MEIDITQESQIDVKKEESNWTKNIFLNNKVV